MNELIQGHMLMVMIVMSILSLWWDEHEGVIYNMGLWGSVAFTGKV